MDNQPILQVENLQKHFPLKGGLLPGQPSLDQHIAFPLLPAECEPLLVEQFEAGEIDLARKPRQRPFDEGPEKARKTHQHLE